MTQRIAITVAGVVATIILAFGLVAAGFGPQSAPSPTAEPTDTVAGSAIWAPTSAEAGPEVETVYVESAPAAESDFVRSDDDEYEEYEEDDEYEEHEEDEEDEEDDHDDDDHDDDEDDDHDDDDDDDEDDD